MVAKCRWPGLFALLLAGLAFWHADAQEPKAAKGKERGIVLDKEPFPGKKYAVLVGAKRYDHANLPHLRYTENDVVELARLLEAQGFEVMLLSDRQGEQRQPTRAAILKHLDQVLDRCKRDDLILLAFAGHGLQFEDDKASYFCPRDAHPGRAETLISLKTLYEKLADCGAGVKLMLVDACRVQVDKQRFRGVNGDDTPPPPKGVSVLFSCSAGEAALEMDTLQHGLFFYHVLEGLRGKAKDQDDDVTWLGLAQYSTRLVKKAKVRQTPVLKGEISDGPLIRIPAVSLRENSLLAKQIAPVVAKLHEALKQKKQTEVALRSFAGPAEAAVQAGPGITKSIGDELLAHGIKVVAQSPWSVAGNYRVLRGDDKTLQGARLQFELRHGKELIEQQHCDVDFLDDEFRADTDGSKVLAPFLGLTGELAPDVNLKMRLKQCQAMLEQPKVHVNGSRIAAAAQSPYALEVVVDDAARPADVKQGRAYVELKKGERYAVRLHNQSEHPAAVTLTIDGLSLFAFSAKKYRHVIVPAGRSGMIYGWFRTPELADSFEVTEYTKSAAAQLLPDTPKLGCITATFAACWPKDAPPLKEERYANLAVTRGDKLATGRGPVVKTGFEEIELQVGAVRASISVRYTRNEP